MPLLYKEKSIMFNLLETIKYKNGFNLLISQNLNLNILRYEGRKYHELGPTETKSFGCPKGSYGPYHPNSLKTHHNGHSSKYFYLT